MLNEIVFLILAAIILVSAIKMLAADEPVHAAIYLGFVLAGVAGIYLTLSAEFLAAIQILIYVGAVVTLILFAVMLTTHASPTEGFAEDRTPLATLGIEGAPPGMDVESLEDVPAEAETVGEAEEHADLERRDEETVRKDQLPEEEPPSEAQEPEDEEGEPAEEEPAAPAEEEEGDGTVERTAEETGEDGTSPDQPDLSEEEAEDGEHASADDEAPADRDEETDEEAKP